MNYERLLRKLRSHPLLWGDDTKSEQVGRLISACKHRLGYDKEDPNVHATWGTGRPAICPNVATD